MTILAFISVIIIHSIPKGKNVKCLIQPFHLQQEMTGGIELKLSSNSQYLPELLKKPTARAFNMDNSMENSLNPLVN
jgi:hypothetical protein